MSFDLNLARQAIKLPKFQKFMLSEMRITEKELAELKGCHKCWTNVNFLPKYDKKISAELLGMVNEGLIRLPNNNPPTMRFKSRKKAIEYITNLKDFKFIFICVR